MDSKHFARIGALVFVAIATTMTAIQMRDVPNKGTQVSADARPAVPDVDPLRDTLIWCQSVGQAGGSDPVCLRAWAENRRRFLAPGARPKERLPAPAEAACVNVAQSGNLSGPEYPSTAAGAR